MTDAEPNTASILIIEDHQLVRQGLKDILFELFPNADIIEADNAVTARQVAQNHGKLDLIVLDLKLPGANGFDLLCRLLKLQEDSKIVILSGEESSTLIYGALSNGAHGYIPKSYSRDKVKSALETILSGSTYVPELAKPDQGDHDRGQAVIETLSARQLEILSLLTQGKTNKEIATELNLSASSVRSYLTIIFKQMNVSNRTEAVYVARILGLVSN